jgi:predicted nucleic acid-binding protein
VDKEQIICDTDVMIDYWNNTQPRHLSTIDLLENQIKLDNVIISAMTKMELLMGASNKEHLNRINKRLDRFRIALINDDISLIALNILENYQLSHGLAIPDAIIAATALKMNFKLFTYNVKDYKFIERLELYDINPK